MSCTECMVKIGEKTVATSSLLTFFIGAVCVIFFSILWIYPLLGQEVNDIMSDELILSVMLSGCIFFTSDNVAKIDE